MGGDDKQAKHIKEDHVSMFDTWRKKPTYQM